MTEDYFASIARRMSELGLQRDRPFEGALAPTLQQELNAKLLEPKPMPNVVEEWDGGC